MNPWFYFTVKKGVSEKEALEELSQCHLKYASSIQDIDNGTLKICGTADPALFPSYWNTLIFCEQVQDPSINWQEQWMSFSPYYRQGKLEVPLSDFSPDKEGFLTLLPGPGFGDLSHPTTKLALTSLSKHASGKVVVDVGTGSGILSLAALSFGALYVYSLDIDDKALEHTRDNARLNQMENKLFLDHTLPKKPNQPPSVLIINMTFAEQRCALKALPFTPEVMISSGILEEQSNEYLDWAASLGLKKLQELIIEDKWSCFTLTPC